MRDSATVRAPPQIGTSPPRSDNDTAVATDLGRTDSGTDAVKFGEASRSLGRHKAAHRRTITHRLRRRLQRDGPQRKPFSGGFVVAAAEKEGEKSSLPPPLLFVPANSHLRNEEGNERRTAGRRGGRNKKRKIATRASSLPLCSRGGGDLSLAHFTHQLFHLTEFQVRPSWSPTFALLLPTDRRPNSLHRSGRGKNTKGALRSTEGGGELKTGSREGERGKKVK